MLLAGLGCMSSVVVCWRTSCCSPGALAPVEEAAVWEDIARVAGTVREKLCLGGIQRVLGTAGRIMFFAREVIGSRVMYSLKKVETWLHLAMCTHQNASSMAHSARCSRCDV